MGLAMTLPAVEKRPELEAFCGVKGGGPYEAPCGDWNGFAPEGTDRRRPGVLLPA
jgi:hypothetical protein